MDDVPSSASAVFQLDLEAVRRSFKELFSLPDLPFINHLSNNVRNLCENVVLQLRYQKAYEKFDGDYLNMFLILMEIPVLEATEYFETAYGNNSSGNFFYKIYRKFFYEFTGNFPWNFSGNLQKQNFFLKPNSFCLNEIKNFN